MLTQEENDFLCRVGPGTPMGDLMRQYWLPVTYTWELEPDGQPQRVRVLGEDLLAWRDSNGAPAFTQERCPHRGVSLYLGRNEECGLRCAYHGWKYDAQGACIDMPNEPPESNFKNKISITAYKGADFGGISWIYMGPHQQDPPGIPQFECGLVPEEQRRHYRKAVYQCNWMQSLEGEMDTTHVYFLHSRLSADLPSKYGTWLPERSAKFHIENTDFGLTYGGQRVQEDGNSYWRTTHFLFPFYGMFPGSEKSVPLSIYMPIDDHHTLHFGIEWHPSRPIPGSRWPSGDLPDEPGALTDGMGPMKPEQIGKFFAKWWPEVGPETEFYMDLDAKKSKSITGMPGVRIQDEAVLWSMGPIMDRTVEHLGAADATIIRVRQRLVASARALQEDGTPPPGVDQPDLYTVRTCQAVLPPDADWLEALGDWHSARGTDYPKSLVTGVIDR